MDQHSRAQEAARVAVVVEDDIDIRELISTVLEQSGFRVHTASDGVEGVDLVGAHTPDIVTVDLGLPGIDGFEVVRRIRLISDCYIIMISARTDEAETLMSLNEGADDYITKPFRPRELRARVSAMFRRPRAAAADNGTSAEFVGVQADSMVSDTRAATSGESVVEVVGVGQETSGSGSVSSTEAVSHNELELDPDTRSVRVGSDELVLTRTEFDLLHTLLLSGRRVRTKADLVRHLRTDGSMGSAAYVSDADERAVEVHIGNLRRKLSTGSAHQSASVVIETVRGVGYRLAPTTD